MSNFLSLLFALIAGGLTSIQSAVNTNLGKYVGSVGASLVSFFVGTITLIIIYLLFGQAGLKNAGKAPLYLFIGGIFGAIFVFSMVYLIPKIGVGSAIAGVIAGQLIIAVIIDHFGLFGLNPIKFNFVRFLGTIFLLIGVKLMSK